MEDDWVGSEEGQEPELDHWLAGPAERLNDLFQESGTRLALVPLIFGWLLIFEGAREIDEFELNWHQRTLVGKCLVVVELPMRGAFTVLFITMGAVGVVTALVLAAPAIVVERAPSYAELAYKDDTDE